MRLTYDLVPEAVWQSLDPRLPYRAESLATDGFAHCTDGPGALRGVADCYFGWDPHPLLVLTVDLDRCGSPWRIDAPGTPYPHVYGAIEREAIVDIRRMARGADGLFLGPDGGLAR